MEMSFDKRKIQGLVWVGVKFTLYCTRLGKLKGELIRPIL